jgi:rod shape-determining protein MreD
MKKKLVYGLMLFFMIVLQTSVLPVLSPVIVTGDIVLMFILAGAIIDGFFAFFKWAIFAGILFDLVTYNAVGLHAVIFLLVVYFVSFFSRRFSVDIRGVGVMLFLIFIVVATISSRAISTLIISWDLKTFTGFWEEFGTFKLILVQIFYNTALFIFCFIALKKIKKFFSIE